ncbi:MAG: ARMT1-like domain-containing protein [Planctomycetaceae bacterium]|jgi:uncharacterized protein with ATP-grasp and redox domains|nr:ARMT1-like domain-containing protein [Planctomycetaceae bacterium]
MPSSIDCSLCLLRQSLEAARFATADTNIHEQVIREAMESILHYGFQTPPPVIGQKIHRSIRIATNNPDPYLLVKQKFNALMISRRDHFRKLIDESDDPFDTAVRLAIAGNTIDFALRANLEPKDIDEAVEQALKQPINGDVNELCQAIENANQILYLTDNSGEIVCDRLLMERLSHKNVVACVRGLPIINDATLDDAKQVGLTEIAPVISNGTDAIGTMLEQCSEEFMSVFRQSDLIISKGLGNYETLIGYDKTMLPQQVAFLFKAKCSFIANYSGTNLGDCVVRLRKGRD